MSKLKKARAALASLEDGPKRRNPVQRELNALGRKVVQVATRYRRKPKHKEKTE